MVETRPPAALVVTERDFLLELEVIALDPPAHFCQIDQRAEGNLLIDSGEPILRRLSFALGPFDQQRLFGTCCSASDRRGANPHAGKARAQLLVCSLAPGDRAPGMFRQTECQLLGAQAFRRRLAIGYFTHFDRRYYRCHVCEPQGTDAAAQRGVGAVARIHQHRTTRHARRTSLSNSAPAQSAVWS